MDGLINVKCLINYLKLTIEMDGWMDVWMIEGWRDIYIYIYIYTIYK